MLELITLKYKKKFAMQYKSLFLLMAISALTSNAYADNKFMRINLLSDTSKIYNIGVSTEFGPYRAVRNFVEF